MNLTFPGPNNRQILGRGTGGMASKVWTLSKQARLFFGKRSFTNWKKCLNSLLMTERVPGANVKGYANLFFGQFYRIYDGRCNCNGSEWVPYQIVSVRIILKQFEQKMPCTAF
jgi:hypothetical protein